MVWSHALFGGYHFNSSSLNTFAYAWYLGGIVVLVVYCCAATMRSVAIVALIVCSCSIHMYSACQVMVVAMIGSLPGT